MKDRLIELETRIAYQEDTIEHLGNLVHVQQQVLQRLEAMCETLVERYQELTAETSVADAVSAENEVPPHY